MVFGIFQYKFSRKRFCHRSGGGIFTLGVDLERKKRGRELKNELKIKLKIELKVLKNELKIN